MTFKEILLYKENGKYYLRALFDSELEGEHYEISVPKIELPIENCSMTYNCYDNPSGMIRTTKIDLGFGELNVLPVGCDDTIYTIAKLDNEVSLYGEK